MAAPSPSSSGSAPPPAASGGGWLLGLLTLLALGLALVGAWVGSTLLISHGGPPWIGVACAVAAFLLIPLVWELLADPEQRGGRLRDAVLRSSALSGLMVVGLLATNPERTFEALATRGDWFLGGSRSPLAESVRAGLFALADRLEWLNDWARAKPYASVDDGRALDPGVHPSPSAGSAPGVAGPSPSAGPTTSEARRLWPIPGSSWTWPLPAELHPAVTAMPEAARASLASVGAWLKAEVPDPLARAKALHDFVATHVAYDYARLAAGTHAAENQTAEAVFASGLGVCAGYANLTHALGRAAGLEVIRLTGDIRRTDDFSAATSARLALPESDGHSWNAVKVNGHWLFLDTTWDAGYGSVATGHTRSYRTTWLFTPPEVLILDHRHYEDRWQLLPNPLSRADWMRQPLMAPHAMHLDVRPLDLDRPIIARREPLTFRFSKPPGTKLLAQWEADGETPLPGRPPRCAVNDEAPGTAVVACPPLSVRARVAFFAKPPDAARGEYVGTVIVE